MSAEPPVPNAGKLAVRWTIGEVRDRGFEMLKLSIACARRLFGPEAKYLVCVNTLAAEEARARSGDASPDVEWMTVTRDDLAPCVKPYLEESCIEGMGWKLAPLRTWPDRYELAIDNDCILWGLPDGMRQWLQSRTAGLLAEDADRALGSFDALCPPGNFNAGIRGLPPGIDLANHLRAVCEDAACLAGGSLHLRDEIEEQGLQAAAMCRMAPLYFVRRSEVSICSPFWPRAPEFGSCGAHFVGMNAAHIPWSYYDRPADEWLDEHWERSSPALYAKAGLTFPA